MTKTEVESKAVALVLKHLKQQGITGRRAKNSSYSIETDTLQTEVATRKDRRRIELNQYNIEAFERYGNIELWAVVGGGTAHLKFIRIPKNYPSEEETRAWLFGLRNVDSEKSVAL
jgi:hypothetical protein